MFGMPLKDFIEVTIISVVVSFVVSTCSVLVGCHPQEVPPPVEGPVVKAMVAPNPDGGGEPEPSPDPVEPPVVMNLGPVHFDTDRSEVRAYDRNLLGLAAETMKAEPSSLWTVTGGCDERGSGDYNQGLGFRRAASVVRALTSAGIRGEQLVPKSIGKSRPLCWEHKERCWAVNRRVEFTRVR